MLVMFYHSFCLSAAMNLHYSRRTHRHDRTLSQRATDNNFIIRQLFKNDY